jgi:beta-glucosidase
MFVHPLWGRGQETYGEDPVLSGVLAAALVRGLQTLRSGVPLSAASPKHFDAYTIEREPERLRIYETIPESQLASYYFPAFRAVVRAGCAMIMCSYNGINATWRGHFSSAPMCASPLLESALRTDFGFNGTVVTDSGAVDFMVERFHRFASKAEAAAAAIAAGADLESGSAYLELPDAVRRGLVSEAVLDRALERVLTTRIRLGLLDPASHDPWSDVPEAVANSEAHRALAFEAALGSLVLLRNPGGLLPLDVPARHRRVAVVGPAANDTLRQVGSYHGCHFDTFGALLPECGLRSPLQGVREALEPRGASVAFAAGCSQHGEGTEDEALLAEAERVARDSDVVLAFVGLRDCTYEPGEGCEGEDRDRDELTLPGRQAQLLARLYASGVPLVIVLSGGGPIAVAVDKMPTAAVLAAWYGGREGPDAVASVLAGARQPSGKLPVTFYNDLAQVAPPLGMDLRDAPGRTYRFLEPVPLWAFGYGLAYTRVEYSAASINGERQLASVAQDASAVQLCVALHNLGPFVQPCDETLMVFAAPPALPATAPLAPKLVLLAFTKVKALRLGERRRVCLDVSLDAAKLPPGDHESSALELLRGLYSLSIGGRKPGPIGKFEAPDSVPAPLLLGLRVVSAAASAV